MFSVIIPCFNEVGRLDKTLAALARHINRTRLEVILIDNNSSDRQVCELYYRYRPLIRHLYLVLQPELRHPFALCRARNLGLRLATFSRIVQLDSDCLVGDGYFLAMEQAFEAWPNGLFVGLRKFICAETTLKLHDGGSDILSADSVDGLEMKSISSSSNYGLRNDRRLPNILRYSIYRQRTLEPSSARNRRLDTACLYAHGGNLAYSKDRAIQIGGHDERFDGCWGYEDLEFACRYGEDSIFYVPGAHVYHQEPVEQPIYQEEKYDKDNNRNLLLLKSIFPDLYDLKMKQYEELGILKHKTRFKKTG